MVPQCLAAGEIVELGSGRCLPFPVGAFQCVMNRVLLDAGEEIRVGDAGGSHQRQAHFFHHPARGDVAGDRPPP